MSQMQLFCFIARREKAQPEMTRVYIELHTALEGREARNSAYCMLP